MCQGDEDGKNTNCCCSRTCVKLVWGMLECLCFCGLVFGWPFMEETLSYQGFFQEVCTTHNTTLLPNSLEDGLISGGANRFISITAKPTNFNQTYVSSNLSQMIPISTTATFTATIDDDTFPIIPSNLKQAKSSNQISSFQCKEQQIKLYNMSTVANFLKGVLMIFVGILYDRKGTLKTRIFAMFFFICANLIMTFTTQATSFLLYLTFGLLATTGDVFMLTNLQFANLLPPWRNTVIMTYHAAQQAGLLIPLLIKMTGQVGLNVQTSFMFMTVGIVPLLVATIAFLPKRRIPWPLPHHYKKNKQDVMKQYLGRKSICEIRPIDIKEPELVAMASLRVLLTNPLYISQLVWCSIVPFWIELLHLLFFRIGDNPMSFGIGNGDEVCWRPQLWALLLAIPFGILLDKNIKVHNEDHHRLSIMQKLFVCYCILWLLMLVTAVMSLVPFSGCSFVICALIVPIRIWLLGLNASTLATLFPDQYFGRLYSLTLLVAALSATLANAVAAFSLTRTRVTQGVYYMAVVMVTAMSLHPWMIWRYRTLHVFRVPLTQVPKEEDTVSAEQTQERPLAVPTSSLESIEMDENQI